MHRRDRRLLYFYKLPFVNEVENQVVTVVHMPHRLAGRDPKHATHIGEIYQRFCTLQLVRVRDQGDVTCPKEASLPYVAAW